jgi:hypothetical protein
MKRIVKKGYNEKLQMHWKDVLATFLNLTILMHIVKQLNKVNSIPWIVHALVYFAVSYMFQFRFS